MKKFLMLFYAPWCPHCKKMMPEWDRMAEMLQNHPDIKVVKIDCQANPDVGKICKVVFYPTIKKITETGATIYRGPRTADKMAKFATEDRQDREDHEDYYEDEDEYGDYDDEVSRI